jgi:nucleoside-diphosphate-sugar epimerase
MARPLVLITGATGHIGFRTLVKALEAGFSARVSSRKLASAERLKELPSIKPYAQFFEAVEIADFTSKGAFDEAVKGVDYILHLASPIPETDRDTFDLESDYIRPAIDGTVGILESASKSPSIKRVVITSSVVVVDTKDGKSTIGPNDDRAPIPLEAQKSNHWAAYMMSKTYAHQAADKYMADNKPSYDTLFVLPGYTYGANEPLTTSQQLYDSASSNHTLIQYIMGVRVPMPVPASFVHVDDAAIAHVAALTAKDAVNGERFLVAAPPVKSYSEIDETVKKLFPEEVKSGLITLGTGEQKSMGGTFETENTREKLLKRELLGLESMVESAVGQYVGLLKKEKGLAN